jgi:hypothetical protein
VIRAVDGERALDEIERRPGGGIAPRGPDVPPPAHPGQARRLQEARDAPAADVRALSGQLGLDAGTPYVPREWVWIARICSVSAPSAWARADGGRCCQA